MGEITQVIEKTVGDLDVVVYERLTKEAFNNEFNSLMFDSGEVFIEVAGKNGRLILETNGHVTIFDIEKVIKICDDERFSDDKVMKMIKNNDIFNSDIYEVDESNWFSFVYFKEDEQGRTISVDDVVMEYIPSSLDELINDMIELYNHFKEL